jgi:hypothetical protein
VTGTKRAGSVFSSIDSGIAIIIVGLPIANQLVTADDPDVTLESHVPYPCRQRQRRGRMLSR